ncbi:hypothetical protein LshimejAT787_2600140 [Lyophyllum shimeji]|uniref:Uncharacterized protein n=1 Tax=Lyophyllum shimeji TaxID=47721 RepID=A0A9P3Q1L4_LYOSH|nr:hypothetical protein LshimejAT787_2600140 [Lyophyllum shimeji]
MGSWTHHDMQTSSSSSEHQGTHLPNLFRYPDVMARNLSYDLFASTALRIKNSPSSESPLDSACDSKR